MPSLNYDYPDTLDSNQGDNKKSVLSWLWFFIKPYKRQFILFTVVRIIRGILRLTIPIMIGLMINYITSARFSSQPYFIFYYIGAYVICETIRTILLEIVRREENTCDLVVKKMTVYSLNHLMSLDMKWHESQGTGGKIQKIFIARNALREIFSIYHRTFLTVVGSLLAAIISLIYVSSLLYALIIILFTSAFLYFSYCTRKKLIHQQSVVNTFIENVLEKVYDFTSTIITIKTLNLIRSIRESAWQKEQELQIQENKMNKIQVYRYVMFNFILMFSFVIVIIITLFDTLGQGITSGGITVGAFVLIVGVFVNIASLVETLGETQEQFFRYFNGFVRLTHMLNKKSEKTDFSPFVHFPDYWSQIIYRDVSFHYTGKKSIIDNLSLTINRGEKIAIIGQSGSGKTTLVKLLLKQIMPKEGRIFIDNIDYKHISKDILLHKVAVILQDSELFDISVKENIFITTATDEEKLEHILKYVNAWDFVQTLPQQADTLIGERGVKLSGGEKQRILLARAMAQEADIVILDEATNALDSHNEGLIQETIQKVFHDKTLIVIAHRLATIQFVDRIIVLQEGQVVEMGNFADLLQKKGVFYELWDKQTI